MQRCIRQSPKCTNAFSATMERSWKVTQRKGIRKMVFGGIYWNISFAWLKMRYIFGIYCYRLFHLLIFGKMICIEFFYQLGFYTPLLNISLSRLIVISSSRGSRTHKDPTWCIAKEKGAGGSICPQPQADAMQPNPVDSQSEPQKDSKWFMGSAQTTSPGDIEALQSQQDQHFGNAKGPEVAMEAEDSTLHKILRFRVKRHLMQMRSKVVSGGIGQ